jgi:hypothetical protein
MLFGRFRLPGLGVLLLCATAGCTSAETDSGFARAEVAVPSYAAPESAPAFCARLAEGTDLIRVPGAMGVLTVTPQDVEATLVLSDAVTEVRGLLDAVREDGGHPQIEAAVDRLVAALQDTTSGSVTDTVRTAVVTGLDEVGRRVQPLCGFPA